MENGIRQLLFVKVTLTQLKMVLILSKMENNSLGLVKYYYKLSSYLLEGVVF